MAQPKRKFKDGDKVIAERIGEKMQVIGAEYIDYSKFTKDGWRCQLAFLTKFGFVNKRRSHRYFFERDLTLVKN
jgi:hypothetical protein